MMTMTSTNAENYRILADGTAVVAQSLTPDQWTMASPCVGWTAADVLDHLVDTQRDFFAERGVALPDRPSGDQATVWTRHAASVARVLSDPDIDGAEFEGFFGPATVGETLLRFYGFDMVAHRWDIARAAGIEHRFSEADLDVLDAAIAGFGDAMYAPDICAPALPPSADADRQTRVLALMGRRG